MAKGTSSDYDVMEFSETVYKISKNAQDVSVIKESIPNVAKMIMRFTFNSFEELYSYNDKFLRHSFTFPYEIEDSKKANWLFVLHTLNFSLWYPKGTRQWKVNGEKGYFGLCNAIKRAYEDKIPLWDPNYYCTRMTRGIFEYIFRSDDGKTCIPFIQIRLMILRDVGRVLLNKYHGTFLECIKSSDYDANKLIKLLFDEFVPYRDEIIYNGKNVRFLIKAKLLVSDIWGYFDKKSEFKLNIEKLISTTFIDYRIPQLLLNIKLLRYSDVLVKRFKNNNKPLQYGSREEIEIRGCSLFVIQEIYKEVQRVSQQYISTKPILRTKEFNISVVVHNFLFALLVARIKDKSLNQYPFYYIRTMFY